MARLLNKDPLEYQREADSFLADLKGFHAGRGTAFHRIPRISGKSIDLYLLYVLVTTRGGWEKVNELDEWDILTPLFDVPTACVNAGLALKQIYLRYLDHYEKVHFHGEEYDSRHDDGSIIHDTSSRLSKRHYVRAYNAVPMTYNTGQHVVSDLLRRSFGLAALRTPCEYEHLLLSLLSPLPNEQDFALNVCTLLSGETSSTTTAGRAQRPSLRLSAHPRLLEAILAHAGIYTDEQTRHYLMTSCLRTRHYNPLHFWRSSVSERRLLRLLSVRYAPERRRRRPDRGDEPEEEWSGGVTAADDDQLLFSSRRAAAWRCLLEDEDSALVRLEEEEVAALMGREAVDDVDDGVFAPGTELGRQERAGQRVLQVVELIRNLSFDADNSVQLANSCACLRLLLLAAHSRWGQLASSARDALGNLCGDLSLRRSASRRLSGWLLELAGRQLLGADRSGVLAALEMLNRLARGADDNDEPLTELLVAEPLMQRVATFLTLHDILLLVAALECMLALTSLGETPCRLVARHSGAVDTLISLVSVEAQSYGPRACILMKVMQTPCSAPVTVAAASTATVSTPAAAVSAFPSTSAVAVVGAGSSVATPVAVLPMATPQRVFRPAAVVKSPLLPHSSGLVTAAVHQSAAAASLQQPPRQTVVASVPSLPPTTVVIGRPVTPVPVAKPTAPQAAVQTPAPAVSSQSAVANNAAARQIPMPLIQQQQVASLPKLSSQGASLVPTENNLWVVKWLQTVCEVCPSNCVEQTALYKQYTASAMVQQWKGIITQGEFANCVKSVFGSSVTAVGRRAPGSGTAANAPMEYYFDGIRSRLQIVTTTVMPQQQQSTPAGKQTQQLQHSSILKAQLSAPPRSNVAEPAVSTQPLQSPLSSGSSHLSQALLGATTPPPLRPIPRTTAAIAVSAAAAAAVSSGSSSLIKSLLASKVAPLVPTHRTGQLNQQLQQPPPSTDALSPSCFSVPQVARNIQNKRVAVNGVSQPSADTMPPATNATTASVVVTTAGVQPTVVAAPLQNGVKDGSPCGSPVPSPRATTPLCLSGGEGLLADLLERKVAPVNGIDRELRIGERGLELVNNNKGSGGVKAELATDDVWPSGPQQPASNNGGGSTSPAKNGGTDLLASALDMAGLMEDLGALDGEEEVVASSPPPPPKPPQQQTQGRKRPADTAAGGDVKRQTAGTPVLTTTTGHQQVVMVPQSVANMMLKLPVSVASGQQLVLPHGQQLIMTSSGQLVVGQQHAQVLVQQGGNTATTNVVVGQPTVGQPQAVLLAQQHSSSARTLIFLPPQQRMLLSQAAAASCVVSQPGQVLVQVSRGGGTPQVVASTLVTSVASTTSSQPRPAAVVHNSSVRPANSTAAVTAPTSFTVQTQTSRSSSPVTPLQTPAPAASQPAAPVTSTRPLPAGLLCEWRGCLRGFPTAHAVYQHAIHAHCPPEFTDIPCLWERCDGMVRKRYSMMTHLQDRHCGDSMLRLMRRRREQLQQTGRTDIPAPAPPPPHPGYANNAAMQAIRRHALAVAAADAKSPAATDAAEKEGPVTKSIRLTAALVLRNLAVYSSQGRRLLRAREPFLLSVAASSVESSRTVCQILADLQQPDDDGTEGGEALTS